MIFYLIAERNPSLRVRLSTQLHEEYGEDFDRMIAQYVDAYEGIYESALDYEEEILADAFAGMNRKHMGADEYTKTVRAGVAQAEKQSTRQAQKQGNGTKETNAPPKKMSIEQTEDGKKYVRADRQVIFGNDPEQWSEQLEDYINGKIRRGEDIKLAAEDGEVLTLTATSAGKLGDNHTSDSRTMSEEAFERKVNAATHIDELIKTSKIDGEPKRDFDKKHGDMAKKGWQYRRAYFEDFDGKYYEVTISAAMNDNGVMVYNIGKMKEEAHPKISGSYAKKGNGLRGFASSKKSIAETGRDVKQKFSGSVLNEEAGTESAAEAQQEVNEWLNDVQEAGRVEQERKTESEKRRVASRDRTIAGGKKPPPN